MKSCEQEFKRHRSSCSPQLLRHPFTTMHTYTVTLDIASHQNQIVYIVLSNKMLSKIVQSFCLQSLCCNNEYTPSWHLSTFYKMRGFIDIWCFARLSSRAPRSWREFAKCRFTHFPSIFSLQVDTYVIKFLHVAPSAICLLRMEQLNKFLNCELLVPKRNYIPCSCVWCCNVLH